MSPVQAQLDQAYSNALGDLAADSAPINGGYVAQSIVRALAEAGERRHPRSASFRFLAPSRIGSLAVAFDAERSSASSGVYTASASQAGSKTVIAQIDVGDTGEPPALSSGMPRIEGPDSFRDVDLPRALRPHFSREVDYRLASDADIFGGAEQAEHLVWLRLHAGPVDAAALAFVADAMHPTPFIAATAPMGTVTADLQLHWSGDLAPLPAGSWLLGHYVMRGWEGRWSIEDATIWSAAGHQLLLSRQTYRLSDVRPGRPMVA